MTGAALFHLHTQIQHRKRRVYDTSSQAPPGPRKEKSDMKKILCFLMALAMTVSLAACGGNTALGGDASGNKDSGREDSPPPEMFTSQSTIEETVLVDEKDVKITATGLTYTDYSAELAVTIENNSTQDLAFHSATLSYSCNSVNGYMVDDGYLGADVPAGKKANETMRFDTDTLLMLGITDIAEMELGFEIDDDDYDTYLCTGPIPLKTTLASAGDTGETFRSVVSSGILESVYGGSVEHFAEDVLYDEEGVRVVSQTLIANWDGEQALLLELENTSSDQVCLSAGDICLNGLTIQGGTWTTDTINPGKRRVTMLNFTSMLDADCLECLGLTDPADIRCSLTLSDMEGNKLHRPEEIHVQVPGKNGSYDDKGDVLYEEDDVRIICKGLIEDSASYSDNITILLLLENGTRDPLNADASFDSLSVNGYMVDFSCFSRTIPERGSGILTVELWDSSLEDNKINGLDDISEIELSVELRDDSYHTVAEPTLLIECGK